MPRRKIGDVLWLALQYAKSDRVALIVAHDGDVEQPAVRNAMRDIKDFKVVQMRLFGTTTSKLDAMIDKMTPTSIDKILADAVVDNTCTTN